MVNGAAGTTQRGLVPAPAGLAALAALGAVAVLVLPTAGSAMPWETDPEPNPTQLALTAYGIVALTAGHLWMAARDAEWHRRPALLTFAYLAGVALAKFVLSPASFHNSTETTLAAFVWLGLGVLLVYLGALYALYRLAGRASSALLVVAVLVFALASRYVLALVLGRDAGEYLGDVFSGAGWWLLVLLAGSALAAVHAFRDPDATSLFRTGAAVVVVYHALWVLFMLRLFG